MARVFEVDQLGKPDTFRERFTDTGRIRKAFGGGASFQVSVVDGTLHVWTVGPLGGWHDFQKIPAGTSFDDALKMTYIPRFYGWL